MSLKKRFTTVLTGDSFIASKISPYSEPEFVEVFDTIRAQDIGFTNLEVLLNDFKGIPAADSGGTYAGAPAELADDLSWAGFHMVARANNHSLDYSYEGMRTTTETLNKKGIAHAGVGETLAEARSPAYLEAPFGRVALLSASSTFAPWGRAGNPRPDFQGRPGLSPLRYTTKYHLAKTDFDSIRLIEKSLGLDKIKEKYRSMGWGGFENPGELSLAGLRFIESENPGVHTYPNIADVNDITKWIKDARRQADWVFFTLHAHESYLDREIPAEFIVDFAKQCIDAGADMFIGHGPHLLRGIEMYKDKPIFYSLGNFIFQNDLVRKHPQDIYNRYGLPFEATPADIYDTRSRNDSVGFPSDPVYWESVIAICEYNENTLSEIRLVPICLGHGKPRPQRGRPFVAKGKKAAKILKDVQRLSHQFGTKLTIDGEKGIINPD